MGSGSSRSRPRDEVRTRRGLASFLCGASSFPSSPSSSSATPAMGPVAAAPLKEEDQLLESVAPAECHDVVLVDSLPVSRKEPSLNFTLQNNVPVLRNEDITACDSSMCNLSRGLTNQLNDESSDSAKCLSETKELVPCVMDDNYSQEIKFSDRNLNVASTSSKLDTVEPLSMNASSTLASIVEVASASSFSSHNCTSSMSSSTSQQEPGDLPADATLSPVLSMSDLGCNSSSVAAVSDPSAAIHLLRESALEETLSHAPALISNGPGVERNGTVLRDDPVRTSSDGMPTDAIEASDREVRRDSRRLIWDAFSRHSSRRNNDSRISSFTEDTDDLESYSRWLLDIRDDLYDHGIDDESTYTHRRRIAASDGRWHSRSEIRDRLRGSIDYSSRHSTFCPSGLHPYGTCSCYSYLANENSSTRASISRIFMLAEALFEVLDELHRQPVSLSLSMASLPAPESVVNSLPVKNHKKINTPGSSDDEELCYICLADYEEGDKIRVLPCRHEYHLFCVDKWLKEIHGVCPLCRGDVRETVVSDVPIQ